MKRIAPFAFLLCLLFASLTHAASSAPDPASANTHLLTLSESEFHDPCFSLKTVADYYYSPGFCLGGSDSGGSCEPDFEGTPDGHYCLGFSSLADDGSGASQSWCCSGTGYDWLSAGTTYQTTASDAYLVTANFDQLRSGDRILPPCGGSTKKGLARFPPDREVSFRIVRFVDGKLKMFNATGPIRVLQQASLQPGHVLDGLAVATGGHQPWDFVPTEAETLTQQP